MEAHKSSYRNKKNQTVAIPNEEEVIKKKSQIEQNDNWYQTIMSLIESQCEFYTHGSKQNLFDFNLNHGNF